MRGFVSFRTTNKGVHGLNNHDLVMLGHGSGGLMSSRLLRNVIFKIFQEVQPTDGAVLAPPAPGLTPVFTTDSYVVKPLFFPGGNIGKIAVNGTANDLAMMGAKPQYLSVGLIIEEGLPLADLTAICTSMAETAREAGLRIVTGDTKVVGRGEADGLYINTAGIGYAKDDLRFTPDRIRAGDRILVSGGIGEHGTAVFAKRLGVSFDPELLSDSAAVWPSVAAVLDAGIVPRVMRDITRGGLATIVNELVAGTEWDAVLDEEQISVDPRVRRACDLWGFDPLHVAAEGRYVAVVGAEQAAAALRVLKTVSVAGKAALIGEIVAGKGRATVCTAIGGRRPVQPLPDELLPRIC
jgi:hydrogenase expression/formation protein HypE